MIILASYFLSRCVCLGENTAEFLFHAIMCVIFGSNCRIISFVSIETFFLCCQTFTLLELFSSIHVRPLRLIIICFFFQRLTLHSIHNQGLSDRITVRKC